jgi:hypothetical protein
LSPIKKQAARQSKGRAPAIKQERWIMGDRNSRNRGQLRSAPFLRRLERCLLGASSRRKDLLANCLDLLGRGEIRIKPDGWGALHGFAGGFALSIAPFSETLAHRRLPQLWLAVTAHCDLRAHGVLDVVRRSTNVEFYSPAADLPERFSVPAQWPQDSLIKGGGARAANTLALLTEPLANLFADARVKEALIAPRGVRIVYQAREGARGAYLLFRQSKFEVERLSPDEISPLIVSVQRLAGHLTAPILSERIANAAI